MHFNRTAENAIGYEMVMIHASDKSIAHAVAI